MVNHAAATVYEPGSVMKVFTLAMGHRFRRRHDRHHVRCGDAAGASRSDHPRLRHGDARAVAGHVFTHSSNIGAARLGLLGGADRMEPLLPRVRPLQGRAQRAGGIGPAADAARLSPNIVAWMSFGHAISVSPLAIATGMSAILNGGVYRPLTLKALAPGQAPAPGRRVIQASTSRTMLNLMRLNVTERHGHASRRPGLSGWRQDRHRDQDRRWPLQRRARTSTPSFAAVFPTDAPSTPIATTC